MFKNQQELNDMRNFRKKLFTDVMDKHTKPKRIPIVSNAWTWKIYDAGLSLSETLHDYNKLYYAVCRHHEKYDFDMYIDLGTRNPLMFTDALGLNMYEIDDESFQINYLPKYPMSENDYPVLLKKGIKSFFYEDILPKKYGWSDRSDSIEHIKAGLHEYNEFCKYSEKVKQKFVNEYALCLPCVKKPFLPLEILMNSLRGLQGVVIDFTRNKEFLDDALQMIYSQYNFDMQNILENYDPMSNYYFLFRVTTMSHNIMNTKQFERYSMPYLTDIALKAKAVGGKILIFAEGSMKHLIDHFRDLPDECICLYSEIDDVTFLKKNLPNLTLAGGYPIKYLSEPNIDSCIDEAKRLIDNAAYDGNYIFGCNKMLSYPDDALPENMLKVNNFVKEYAIF